MHLSTPILRSALLLCNCIKLLFYENQRLSLEIFVNKIFSQVVALGGESMRKETITEWRQHVTLINTYGVTEATVYQAAHVYSPISG
jgi:non-ribosomal peptide synthetase component F